MYSILPFALIIISLAIIIIIIVRRYPQLTLLDVDSIPEVKIEKKKVELLKKRLAQESAEADAKRREMIKPVIQKLKQIQLAFRIYVGDVHQRLLEYNKKKKEAKNLVAQNPASLNGLLQSAESALNQKNYDIAEAKFIEVIKIDPKNLEAYNGLGQVYMQKGELEEAKEAFEFILKLNSNSDDAMMKLAEIMLATGNKEKAIEYLESSIVIDDSKATRFVTLSEVLSGVGHHDLAMEAVRQAVELEPNNPKYLDMLVEFGVKCGNKETAEDAWRKLRMVNPENSKLTVLRDKIDKMPS